MRSLSTITILGLLAWAPLSTATAAEIRLKPAVRVESTIVTLGEVADVIDMNNQEAMRLQAIELFPSPAAGGHRNLSIRELQDTLSLRGEKIFDHDFSGVICCTISNGSRQATGGSRLSTTQITEISERAAAAIQEHLTQSVSSEIDWIAHAKLSPADASTLAEGGRILAVRGGADPWYGPQRFEVTLEAVNPMTRQPARLWVDADIDAPVSVAFAKRSVGRGGLLSANDIEMRSIPSSEVSADYFQSPSELIGMEAASLVGVDRPILRRSVQAQLLVHRNEVVTVYARAAGVVVQVMGRAAEDGAEGDLILVEPLERGAKGYYGRVAGLQTIEVFASSTANVSSTPVAPTASRQAPATPSAPARSYGPASGAGTSIQQQFTSSSIGGPLRATRP